MQRIGIYGSGLALPVQQNLAALLEEARRSEFKTLAQAVDCANNRYVKGKDQWIVLGDNGVYWVVRPHVAKSLVKAGYELAYGY
jgi:hypothetical protein